MSHEGAVIGIDIGGTKTQLGRRSGADLDVFSRFLTPQDPEEAATAIVNAIKTGTEAGEGSVRIGSIGIGCPGPLDHERGLILSPPNLPHWSSFSLMERLKDAFCCPVFLENDANAGALGEALFGSGKGFENVFYMTISTGIGAGIVLDGRIYRGHSGLAGELWAFRPELFALRQFEGPNAETSSGSLLDLASGTGIVRQVEKLLEKSAVGTKGGDAQDFFPRGKVTCESLLDAYASGCEPVVKVMEMAQSALSAAVVFVLATLAPDVVVLGGGLCRKLEWYVRPIQRMVQEAAPFKELRSIPIVRAELWDTAVLQGALRLAECETGSNSFEGEG